MLSGQMAASETRRPFLEFNFLTRTEFIPRKLIFGGSLQNEYSLNSTPQNLQTEPHPRKSPNPPHRSWHRRIPPSSVARVAGQSTELKVNGLE